MLPMKVDKIWVLNKVRVTYKFSTEICLGKLTVKFFVMFLLERT